MSLCSTARSLGASVVELRDVDGHARPVPMECSAAVFPALESIDDSYESLAVLAAGLYPLRPSYLEQRSSQERQPPESTAHEWHVEARSEGSGGGIGSIERVRSLLALARRQQSCKTRLFEGWRVALMLREPSSAAPVGPGCGGIEGAVCQLDVGEVQALLSSGGAVVEADAAEADLLLVSSAEMASEVLHPVPCYTLSEWMRCVVGEVAPSELIRCDERAAAPLPSAAHTVAQGRGSGGVSRAAADGVAKPDGGGKRRTRHSAPLAAPQKRQRAL